MERYFDRIANDALVMEKWKRVEELKEMGIKPFGERFDKKNMIGDILSHTPEEELTFKTAGRIMAYRGKGKTAFVHIEDISGKIQVYLRQDELGEENYALVKKIGVGDIIGVEGTLFLTSTGELTIRASVVTLLCKNIRSLPEKFHGLTDVETRYRKRYVDLIMNKDVRDTFVKRTKIISAIRRILDGKGFLEVETPLMHPILGGAAARPFITHHNTLDIDLYLRIAPELYLKRCIVAGFEKVYELGRTFRNEGMSVRHNPEFTMIELYQAFADYNDMMELTENMIAEVCKKVNGTTKVTYQGTEIDFMPPWRRVTMVDAVKEYAGVDFATINSDEEAQAIAKEKNLEFPKPLNTVTKGEVLNALYEEFGEAKMIQPTFVMDYPVENSPLTKKKRGNAAFTERFEVFVFGRELGNAYSELNDPIVQRQRFEQQAKKRELGDDEAYMLDEQFMSALETGMPPTGGLGIGVDRLIMFLTDSASIRDVILFPTMKPQK